MDITDFFEAQIFSELEQEIQSIDIPESVRYECKLKNRPLRSVFILLCPKQVCVELGCQYALERSIIPWPWIYSYCKGEFFYQIRFFRRKGHKRYFGLG